MFDFLKKVPLFANLPDEDLNRLCEAVIEEDFSKGQILFTEGEVGEKAYVIMSGEIEILKESGGRPVLLATRHSGDVIGEMSLLEMAPRFASGRAGSDSKLLAISHKSLDHLLNNSPSAAKVLLSTITNRLRTTELTLRQSEKMAYLGTLTAGISHELNNPASAARRGSEQLSQAMLKFKKIFLQLQTQNFSDTQWQHVENLYETARMQSAEPVDLDSLERSDREAEIEDWLDQHNIDNSWEYAPALVNVGFQTTDLEEINHSFPGGQMSAVIQWVCEIFDIFNLLEEIHQGTSRIGEIVKSLKSYVYLDQAPVQEVDLHEGLDNTLVMLRSKMKSGVVLERDYSADLPRIMAYGSELNQVWTNILDNAIDAMDGNGTISIATHRDEDWVNVELVDNGPGIPPDVQEKLFSPFFTTKPLGKGTGLGLNISFNIIQKHKGDIRVFSQPGRTCFSVRLPINLEEVEQRMIALPSAGQLSQERIKEIIETSEIIAVVGMSGQEDTPAHSVPKYLKGQGYYIIPVNPNYDQILGEKSYPDLLSIPDPVDIVLVFRRSEFVPEVVEQAIEMKAKVVWMQEGIVNQIAARQAEDSGIEVVMDTCLRKTHQRLTGGL